MTVKQSLIDEIEVLLQFKLDSTQEGIKIHHTAKPGLREAAARLHAKGLLNQPDGGYLTDLGYEAAEHLQHALNIMTG
jgi:uncharacterized protein (TIGR02647 family)